MIRMCHLKRRKQKQACRAFVIWSCAILVAMLGNAAWRHLTATPDTQPHVPAYLTNPDASDETGPVAPRVSGDGVLDLPRTVVKIVPALAGEATDAVQSGDVGVIFRQFMHWIASGEALQSQPFWLFCSIMLMGIIAVFCCSLVNHFMAWRHRLQARSASAADTAAPEDTTELDSKE